VIINVGRLTDDHVVCGSPSLDLPSDPLRLGSALRSRLSVGLPLSRPFAARGSPFASASLRFRLGSPLSSPQPPVSQDQHLGGDQGVGEGVGEDGVFHPAGAPPTGPVRQKKDGIRRNPFRQSEPRPITNRTGRRLRPLGPSPVLNG